MKTTYSGSKVQQFVGRITFNHGDISFDEMSDDVLFMRDSLVFVDAMIEDLLPDSIECHRRYLGWLASSLVIDVIAFGETLKAADTYFKNSIRTEPISLSLKCFKRTLRGPFLGFFSPIFDEISAFEMNLDPTSFRRINTYINFLRRINLKGISLVAECEAEYVSFEENYFSDYDDDLLTDLSVILKEWFSDFSYRDFVPQHGPGSVAGFAGKLPIQLKYSAMQTDERLTYFSKYVGDLSTYVPGELLPGLQRCSEIVCVPKTIISNRTISREPCSLQYFQQGVRRCISRHIRQSNILNKHICLEDQTISQDMARIGSKRGKFATIDLSSASDSVSLYLVKRVFRKVPALLVGLICTRSDETLMPSGVKLAIQKFAPMGSATCFPIETVVFSACCELAARRRGHKSRYRVYGDDIIIEEELVDELLHILDQCGFIVNRSKSFSGFNTHNFREACGGEYYDGEVVRPLRIPRFFRGIPRNGADVSADCLSSVLAFCNICFDRGFVSLRNCIFQLFSRAYNDFSLLPFSDDGRLGIQTYPDCCTNWKIAQRYNVGNQIFRSSLSGECVTYGSLWHTSLRCIASVTRYDEMGMNKFLQQCSSLTIVDEEMVRLFEWLRRHSVPEEETKVSKAEYYVDSLPQVLESEVCSIRPVRNFLRVRWVMI